MSAFMAAFRGPNSELKKLTQYSPFLNIVKQAISAINNCYYFTLVCQFTLMIDHFE